MTSAVVFVQIFFLAAIHYLELWPQATSVMYNRVVDLMLEHIAEVGDRCNIVCGTHNETGALHAAGRLAELSIPPHSDRVVFGQIYGMADQISVPLAAAGFTVYKVRKT